MTSSIASFESFDDTNPDCMDKVAELLSIRSIDLFHDITTPSRVLKVHVRPVHKIRSKVLNGCLNLVDQNLREHYIRNNGKDWKIDKKEEMSENGLVYVYYKDQETGALAAFMSYMLTYNDPESKDEKVLYLYEIHVSREYQSSKIGTTLIDNYHKLSQDLNNSNDILESDATSLTVFSDNLKALNWYKKMGYKYTKDSPRDKVLRKKVVKPPYYLLTRKNIDSNLT
ncbi:hypothetical protein CAAN1_05S01728 [[Candida] anglica]|uniref:N-alpha-acetyltransferase 40 n=1 Tax=[Candida] anglica TaxID=148631 RepID=A0ABP0ECQ1_9ASCO